MRNLADGLLDLPELLGLFLELFCQFTGAYDRFLVQFVYPLGRKGSFLWFAISTRIV